MEATKIDPNYSSNFEFIDISFTDSHIKFPPRAKWIIDLYENLITKYHWRHMHD